MQAHPLQPRAALSALLFLMTAVLWVRSYWVADVVGYVDPPGAWAARASSYRGAFRAYLFRDIAHPTDESSHIEYIGVDLPTDNDVFGALAMSEVLGAPLNTHAQFGFVVQRFPNKDTRNCTSQVPDWLVLIMSGILPAQAVLSWRRRRKRIKEGRCIRCGYDLRSTPRRCPECGEPAAVPQVISQLRQR